MAWRAKDCSDIQELMGLRETTLSFKEDSRQVAENSRRSAETFRRVAEDSRRLPQTLGRMPRALVRSILEDAPLKERDGCWLLLDRPAPLAYSRTVVIVETKSFTARIDDLLTADEYRSLQLELVRQPTAGRVIPGTGGIRKLRWGALGRGRRGGARVIYFWHAVSETILMLFAYPKNEQGDLTPAQSKALRLLVESEYP
jgi:mRNA-degrading endonuclease RelE of RelBE toxin-antitoxin system